MVVGTYHECGAVGGALSTVRQRPGHREVPVEADDEQVEHTGVAGQVVECQPGVADVGPQWPPAQQRVHREQRHGDEADGEVRHCQTVDM